MYQDASNTFLSLLDAPAELPLGKQPSVSAEQVSSRHLNAGQPAHDAARQGCFMRTFGCCSSPPVAPTRLPDPREVTDPLLPSLLSAACSG